MPYYFKEVKCDTLAELQALREHDLGQNADRNDQISGSQYREKAPPPGYNFHPDYCCPEYVLDQTGPGMGYERCNLRRGHSGKCKP